MKRTSGNWETKEAMQPQVKSGDKVICTLEHHGYQLISEETTANSKLIAAAPDLLEALQIVENIKEGLFHGIVWFTKEEELKISNAIKKATE